MSLKKRIRDWILADFPIRLIFVVGWGCWGIGCLITIIGAVILPKVEIDLWKEVFVSIRGVFNE